MTFFAFLFAFLANAARENEEMDALSSTQEA